MMDFTKLKQGDYVYAKEMGALYKVRLDRPLPNGKGWVAYYHWEHSTIVYYEDISHITATRLSPNILELKDLKESE